MEKMTFGRFSQEYAVMSGETTIRQILCKNT